MAAREAHVLEKSPEEGNVFIYGGGTFLPPARKMRRTCTAGTRGCILGVSRRAASAILRMGSRPQPEAAGSEVCVEAPC